MIYTTVNSSSASENEASTQLPVSVPGRNFFYSSDQLISEIKESIVMIMDINTLFHQLFILFDLQQMTTVMFRPIVRVIVCSKTLFYRENLLGPAISK